MIDRRLWREYNWLLLGTVLALLTISLFSVYSATLNSVTAFGTPLNILFPRHIGNVLIGLIFMVAMTLLNYRLLSSIARVLYLVALGLLLVVHAVGLVVEGAQSWLVIGARTIQPAELAKLTVIIVLAAYWAHFEERRATWPVQLGGLLLAAIPLLLVLAQPDFGTALVFGIIWMTMAWGAGIRWQQLAIIVLATLPLVFIGWTNVLNTGQQSRLLTFYWMMVDPTRVDPNQAYNIQQALVAIGSGGLFGSGLTRGLLSQGNYIPVQYTDFIFAVVGEEMGFAGGAVLIMFQAALLWLALSIAARAQDTFGRLIAVGIFGMLFSHVLVNIGMNLSLMPVTGLPLPFISYGGTFTVVSLAAIGLLQSIAMRWRRITF